jgi:hypothetical protein
VNIDACAGSVHGAVLYACSKIVALRASESRNGVVARG